MVFTTRSCDDNYLTGLIIIVIMAVREYHEDERNREKPPVHYGPE